LRAAVQMCVPLPHAYRTPKTHQKEINARDSA